MKKLLVILILLNFSFSYHKYGFDAYVSPYIQIGINNNSEFFFSYQTTFGGIIVNPPDECQEYEGSPDESIGQGLVWDIVICVVSGIASTKILTLGITFGHRITYKRNLKKWSRFNYIDGQYSPAWGLYGFGIGKIFNKYEKFNKYKLWFGSVGYGLLSYDYINYKDNPKHHFGYFQGIPIIPAAILSK